MSSPDPSKPKKILSIDGGGIKGVFPASFLASIEQQLGGNVADHFDLIVGTSTGGIIALGLGLGYSAQEILDFYKQRGPEIFGGNSWFTGLRRLISSKYRPTALRDALQDRFGDRLLGESTKRLVIPSLNLDTGEVYIHKTAHHTRFGRDYKERVVDIALSTSAAPTYFPAHRMPTGSPLIDGGMWANNPTGLAVVEAIGVLGWSPASIQVLSLGCTTEPVRTGGNGIAKGLSYWAMQAVETMMSAQSSSSTGTAAVLTSHAQIKRINPSVARRKYSLDNCEVIDSLEGLGSSCARTEYPHIEHFFKDEAEPFVPFYQLTK